MRIRNDIFEVSYSYKLTNCFWMRCIAISDEDHESIAYAQVSVHQAINNRNDDLNTSVKMCVQKYTTYCLLNDIMMFTPLTKFEGFIELIPSICPLVDAFCLVIFWEVVHLLLFVTFYFSLSVFVIVHPPAIERICFTQLSGDSSW